MSLEVPNGWVTTTLGELSQISGGTTPSKEVAEFWEGGSLFWATPTDITALPPGQLRLSSTRTMVSDSALEKTSLRMLPVGSVLMTSRATIGYPAINTVPMATNQGFANFHPSDKYDAAFLAYWMVSNRTILERSAAGSTFPEISKSALRSIPIALPPLHEQRRIAEILSSVDDAIASTQAVISQTERVKNSTVLDLVQGKHVPGDRKPTTGWRIGNLGVSTIPATWNIVRLTSIAKLESGHTPSKKVPEYWSGKINWLSLHDTKSLGKRKIFDTVQKATQLGIDNSSARLLPAGTVCLSRTASIGHCVILGTEMATSQDFANYVCGECISNNYLMFLFRSMGDVWNQLSSGSTHKTIYMPIFEQLQIILPPLSVQMKIVQAVNSIYDQIDLLTKELTILEATRSTLMSDLLTGRKRVIDDLPMAAE